MARRRTEVARTKAEPARLSSTATRSHSLSILAPVWKRRHRNVKPKGHWQKRENCREFFCSYAAEVGFDPQIAESWATVTSSEILAKRVIEPNLCGTLTCALRVLARCPNTHHYRRHLKMRSQKLDPHFEVGVPGSYWE